MGFVPQPLPRRACFSAPAASPSEEPFWTSLSFISFPCVLSLVTRERRVVSNVPQTGVPPLPACSWRLHSALWLSQPSCWDLRHISSGTQCRHCWVQAFLLGCFEWKLHFIICISCWWAQKKGDWNGSSSTGISRWATTVKPFALSLHSGNKIRTAAGTFWKRSTK